jgi:hypothetical protein
MVGVLFVSQLHHTSHKKTALTPTSNRVPRTVLPSSKSVRLCARDNIIITTDRGEHGSRSVSAQVKYGWGTVFLAQSGHSPALLHPFKPLDCDIKCVLPFARMVHRRCGYC